MIDLLRASLGLYTIDGILIIEKYVLASIIDYLRLQHRLD